MCIYFCFSELKLIKSRIFRCLSLHLLKGPGLPVVCVAHLESLLRPSTLPRPQSAGSPLCAFASTEPSFCWASFLFIPGGFLAIKVLIQCDSEAFVALPSSRWLHPLVSRHLSYQARTNHSRLVLLVILVSLQTMNSSKTEHVSYSPLYSLRLARCLYTVGAQ